MGTVQQTLGGEARGRGKGRGMTNAAASEPRTGRRQETTRSPSRTEGWKWTRLAEAVLAWVARGRGWERMEGSLPEPSALGGEGRERSGEISWPPPASTTRTASDLRGGGSVAWWKLDGRSVDRCACLTDSSVWDGGDWFNRLGERSWRVGRGSDGGGRAGPRKGREGKENCWGGGGALLVRRWSCQVGSRRFLGPGKRGLVWL